MDRILFIIYHDEIRFVPNKDMGCKEFYLSLGGDEKEYSSLIRGMIKDGKIVFMKDHYQYDSEVILMARKCAPLIKKQLNMPDLVVGCGLRRGKTPEEWEPLFILNNIEETALSEEAKELLGRVEHKDSSTEVIEFKNNTNDTTFAKYASRFSFYLLVAAIVVKIILYYQHKININSRWVVLIIAIQLLSLFICMIAYRLKSKSTKYFGLIASAALFFLFDLADIIIGIINLLFTVDQTYIVKILELFNKIIHKKKK